LHLSAGWFRLFPLLFAIHDAEEATFVWMMGGLHNSISYTTLDVPRMLMAISFELAMFMTAAAWAAAPGGIASGDLHLRGVAGRLYGPWVRPSLSGMAGPWLCARLATALPFVVFCGLFVYAKVIKSWVLSWPMAAASFGLGALVMLL
jgi:hypothetical protein